MGDAGFKFNRKKDEKTIIGYTPYKKSKKKELTDEQKDFNTRLSSLRVIVENTFGSLKKWRILAGKFRHFSPQKNNFFDVDQIFFICALLTQRKLKKNPLRK